jgi:very-short-patch-repair endonuclease/DNA polymerase III delta prime subunit
MLRNWLKAGWERVGSEPDAFVKKTLTKAGRKQCFEDDDARVDALEDWLAQKRSWESEARDGLRVLDVFQTLFELRARFQRESEKYQLYLADGMLTLPGEQGDVSHPLLLQRVELRFDASAPAFTLVESDDNPELYTPLLRHAGCDGEAIQAARQMMERDHFHPLEGEATSAFLRDLVQRLWQDGVFAEDPRDAEDVRGPCIHRAPHLFLGGRDQGFVENLERYIASLEAGAEVPESLARVVGIESARRETGESGPVDLLLTQPANAEQQEVIRRLEETGAVLVQGPPGTGKSHTIANLIGHLLAENKSILVTSHTSKALRVVREKLAEPLRPLCVSVLDTDEESGRQLEESVSGIVNTLAAQGEKKLSREIEKLAAKREQLGVREVELGARLQSAVAGEYEPLQIGDDIMAPAEVARRIAESGSELQWLAGPVDDDAPPLEADEVAELYRLNHQVGEEDEDVLASPLPDPTAFPSATAFASLHDDLKSLDKRRPEDGQDLWLHEEQGAVELDELLEEAKHAVSLLDRQDTWLIECIEAGRAGEKRGKPWRELLQRIETCADRIPELEAVVLEHGPGLVGEPPPDAARTAGAVASHLESGKGLGRLTRLTKPAWNALVKVARVGDEPATRAEHFRALEQRFALDAMRADLAKRWDRLLVPLGAPEWTSLGARPETRVVEYAADMRRALDWQSQSFGPCVARMEELGLDWKRLQREAADRGSARSELERVRDVIREELPGAIERRRHYLEWRDQRDRKSGWLVDLDRYTRRDPVFPVIRRMKSAIKKGDYDAYAEARTRIEELVEMQGVFRRRNELLTLLQHSAPSWARDIAERRPPHDGEKVPGDVAAAWRLRACEQALAGHERLDVDTLQDRLDATREELFGVTARYVEKLAWRAQARRIGLAEQQALTGWLGLHKKIGKGTGKNVARLKEEAKQALVACRAAVPVWIMPLSRVMESFDLQETRFDVVILDEASQSDVLGLTAFALAREVVVVGDHEQVSPYAVGQKGDRVQSLIDELLVDVPNKQLYDGKTSVYDLARQSFGGTIRLLEHFRCVPDIIQFSNDLCYRGEVRALREASSSPLMPHLVAHRVKGGGEHNGVNEKEALEVASLVTALCRLPEYEGKSVGVISMVGTDQALYIDSVLRRRLTAAEYQRRRVLCGNASQFQGDERDVLFISMVSSPREGGPLPMRQREDFRKVVNVAASRARDQLWVVHSLEPGRDLKPGDLRHRLISHAENPAALRPKRDESRQRHGSELERRVYEHVQESGYRLLQHYEVGEHVLDLVLEGAGGRRIAVQCDGDRELAPEAIAEALTRQVTLERLGWRFVRVRASEFFQAPEKALRRLDRRLAALDMQPPPEMQDAGGPADGEALDARVRKRAEQIRARWQDVPSVSSVLGPAPAEEADAPEEESEAPEE